MEGHLLVEFQQCYVVVEGVLVVLVVHGGGEHAAVQRGGLAGHVAVVLQQTDLDATSREPEDRNY